MLSFCFCWDAQISREKTCADLKIIIYRGPRDFHICKGVQCYFLLFCNMCVNSRENKELFAERGSDYFF